MTCRAGVATGDFRSRLGYTKQTCATWLDRKRQKVCLKVLSNINIFIGLTTNILFQLANSPSLLAEYSMCGVIWAERDVSTLARVRASGLDLRISQTSGGAINFG